MTEPRIEVKVATAYVPIATELLADGAGLRQDLEDLLAGRPSRHGPRKPVPRPAAYDRLLGLVQDDGLVREIVEFHGPKPYEIDGVVVSWQCHGCEFSGYEAEPPEWPCETTGLVASRVDVDLRETT